MKYDADLDRLFAALADGARREIVARLARCPASVSELAAAADLSLPSAHAHLAKLDAAGLTESEKRGRTRTVRLRADAVAPAQNWLDEQASIWSSRLDRLDHYATNLNQNRKDAT